jgi:O-succinylbenzoate synthase
VTLIVVECDRVSLLPAARVDETIIMSNDTLKIKRKLSALTSSLDDLETSLAALLSQSLPELVLGLDTIQQAKLQVVVPYLVYDLVFGPS